MTDRPVPPLVPTGTADGDGGEELEDLDAFRTRARAFVRGSLGPSEGASFGLAARSDEEEVARIAREREVQRLLFDAGLAGVCVPRAYGGQGLTPAHQRVLDEELEGYESALRIQSPTMTPCLAVLLDYGTEEQKQRHVPAILRGEELWLQFLSEPTSGSDLAAARTTAVRDGDEWVLNGSKIWTTGAWFSDWGLCLARTNWDVPKHRGLTVFMLPVDLPGMELRRIEMLNGNREFCEEFFTDVRVPDAYRIGDVDQGWTVCTRWMFHERMLHNSPYVTWPVGMRAAGGGTPPLEVAWAAGRLDDDEGRDLVGESRMLELVAAELKDRVADGVAAGAIDPQAAAVVRLFIGTASARQATIALELVGDTAAAWDAEDGVLGEGGTGYLMRQAGSIGGGTTEMARNVISERVLGMPREPSADRDVAFRDVRHGR